MNKKLLEKSAEILVECGYAIIGINGYMEPCYWRNGDKHPKEIVINPLADTLEGRRQADAIEDWLWIKQTSLWDKSFHHIEISGDGRKMRLDRIKWYLDNLRDSDGE